MKPNNNAGKKIKYFLYRRKSTEAAERQALSLESQLEEAAKRFPDLDIIQVEPESRSAFEPDNRPVFADMLQRIRNGEAQGIVAWHPDRLARNPKDAAEIIYLLDIGKLKDLKFCSYYFDNSPEGKMMLQITLSQSKYSSDKLSNDVKRGVDKKAAMGWRPNRAPLGYKNSITKLKGEQDVAKDPLLFERVQQMFRLMLTGNYTMPALLKEVNGRLGLRMPATKKMPEHKMRLSTLYRILTDTYYYGYYEWRMDGSETKTLIKGNHEPMITEAEYYQIQKMLGRTVRPRTRKNGFAFTGMMKCGFCGAAVTAEQKFKHLKNGTTYTYVYYRCTRHIDPLCTEKSVEMDEFHAQVDFVLQQLEISDKFRDWALQYLHAMRKGEAKTRESVLAAKTRSLEKVTGDIDNLVLKFTSSENANGELLSMSEYQSLRGKLLTDKAALEADLKKQGEELEDWVELSEKTFNFARYARIWFQKGDIAVKRAIFACLGSDPLLQAQKIALTLRKPYKRIINERDLAEVELEWFAPLENPITASNVEQKRKEFPVMSG